MNKTALTVFIKDKALQAGFDLVGISPAASFPEMGFYKEWLEMGYEAQMGYMARDPQKREYIQNVLPGAKSVISCAFNYNTDLPYSTTLSDNTKGWLSRYAWGDDYHDHISNMLNQLVSNIKDRLDQAVECRFYVDTGPVLERTFGKYAGIGWIGKNTCLINQDIGSWLFIGEIITDLELEYDSTAPDRCGTCTMCIDACPTQALVKPRVLDSNRCISYLTIELKGPVPRELRDGMENNIYGCDICQDVCPWNTRAPVKTEQSFQPREGLYNPDLSDLAKLSVEDFRVKFKGSPVKRTKRRGLLRSVMIAMGNSGEIAFLPHIKECLRDEEALVRVHAAWALFKLQGADAHGALRTHLENEDELMVREEIEILLNT